MNMEKIYNEIKQKISKEYLLYITKKNNESPFEYLISLIRNEYNIPKTSSYTIVKKLLEYYNI